MLDLEALANHRSSVLGHIPGVPQPSQKRFDSLVWDALRRFNPARPVYIESESKKVGNVRVPDALIDAMRASPASTCSCRTRSVWRCCWRTTIFRPGQRAFLPAAGSADRVARQGRGGRLDRQVQAGQTPAVVLDLLKLHYDPTYAQSISRNFSQYGQALPCVLRDRSPAALNEAAASLIAGEAAAPAT
ncbi:tRNA 2-selenouridine synthase [Hydrogenophaga sp. T4]|nr:tRNA 2-selenouridine synthase [Hydrogenophaga sp. T4]